MTDLELFIRKRLGQKVFDTEYDEYNRPKHLRFDMSFGIYTTYYTDPVLGVFYDVIPENQRMQYVVKFYKGGCIIYFSSGYEMIEIFDFESGLGTVEIIQRLLTYSKAEIPIHELRDIKINKILN
jgi:hypothetical protein